SNPKSRLICITSVHKILMFLPSFLQCFEQYDRCFIFYDYILPEELPPSSKQTSPIT
ncbi:unnamed protein product, partial [Musa acuminata subsp. burmannicoides]